MNIRKILNLSIDRRPIFSFLPTIVLLMIVTLATVLMSRVSSDADDFARFYIPLFILSSMGIVFLTYIISVNFWHLWRDAQSSQPGAKLTLRFLGYFSLISVLPLLLIFYLSIQILQKGVDSWFDVRVENALNDAISLGGKILELRQKEHLKQTELIAQQLQNEVIQKTNENLLARKLSQLQLLYDAEELNIYDSEWNLIALSQAQPMLKLSQLPNQEALLHILQERPYVALHSTQTNKFYVQVILPYINNNERFFIQTLFSIPSEINRLTRSVEEAYDEYKQLLFIRVPLKRSLLFTLILALLISILSATLVAFVLSRRLLAPIRDLAAGTEAVSKGDYSRQLPLRAKDELSTLVQSFNSMMKEIDRSQQQAINQSAYLEAVLGSISSGVMTIRHQNKLQIANSAAADILVADLSQCLGSPFNELTKAHPHLAQFVNVVQSHLSEQEPEWRDEIIFNSEGERRVLICHGSALPNDGFVIVFDDVTQLINAEKESAWSEVARRIAHEIKNPLTPIQLSAERLRHKYLENMSTEEGALLDKLTHTIIQQVETMKQMVDAFSEYARSPQAEMTSLDLTKILDEVVEMYCFNTRGLTFERSSDPHLPPIVADPGQIRQVLHNLIKNVMEIETDYPLKVTLITRTVMEEGKSYVELIFHDNGPGLPAEIAKRPFEPYATTKLKGTGLGLAVVKKIIEEHGGHIQVEPASENGTTFRITLPADVKQDLTRMNMP